jgi:hypothetical protein
MKNAPGFILVIAGIALAVYGIVMFGDSGASANVMGMEMSVQDNDMRMQSYLFMGLGVAAFFGGLYLVKRK